MADVLELVILRKLESPNVVRGFHWRAWSRETKAWQAQIRCAMLPTALATWSLIEGSDAKLDARGQYKFVERRRKERRLVVVTREVENARRFIRDEDNLRFSTKPLNDALKRLGLVYDDSRHWMVQPGVVQRASHDGIARTLVHIERLTGATLGT